MDFWFCRPILKAYHRFTLHTWIYHLAVQVHSICRQLLQPVHRPERPGVRLHQSACTVTVITTRQANIPGGFSGEGKHTFIWAHIYPGMATAMIKAHIYPGMATAMITRTTVWGREGGTATV